MKMSLERNKKIRDSLYNLLKNLYEEIDSEIISDNISQEKLIEFNEKLNDKLKRIKELNDSIIESIAVKNIDNEIVLIEEQNDKLLSYISKVNFKMKKYDKSENAYSQNVQAGHVVAEKKILQLPKIYIDKFSGEPDKYLEFWDKFENTIHKNTDLSDVDKFTYLKSLLSGIAANHIEGLSLTENNYKIAISLIQERFGRHEMLVHTHLNNLLNLIPVRNSNDVRNLRKLYDKCNVQIRNLESLNVTADSYSGLLCPILLKLMPADLTLNFTRNLENSEKWDIHSIMKFLRNEIESRERVESIHNMYSNKATFNDNKSEYNQKLNEKLTKFKQRYNNNSGRNIFANNLTTESVNSIDKNNCIFCSKNHNSECCLNLSIEQKKELLRKEGRCFLCLLRKHRIKDCKSKIMCELCNKKHNKAICFQLEPNSKKENEENIVTISHCTNSDNNMSNENIHSKIYLQTCSVIAKGFHDDTKQPVRVLLDNGSMRSFITCSVSRKLNLPIIRTETLSVYAFGAEKVTEKCYNVVRVKLENRNEPLSNIEIEAIETEQISAASLPKSGTHIKKLHNKLKNLQLADDYESNDSKISILIGTDHYYNVVSGRIKKLQNNLVATETLFGWCLHGCMGSVKDLFSMKIIVEERDISKQIETFWNLENLGIECDTQDTSKIDSDMMNDFQSTISYNNSRYKVGFPWKSNLKPLLKNNREVAHQRFLKLRTNFKNDHCLFSEYKAVLDSYLDEKIIEPVEDTSDNNTFYLPHRAVIRDDKSTSKIRIVFDASAHAKGEFSLNNCLHTGDNLTPDIFSILVKFRNHPVAVTADIRQAFLQIEIKEEDRDFTRFFWDDEPWKDSPGKTFKIFRFNRVLFGVKSSPFLLAATIKHHIKKFKETFPETYKILSEALYVDDLIFSERDVDSALERSLESFNIFQDASMFLRKWKTNSPKLQENFKLKNLELDEVKCDLNLSDHNSVPSKVLGMAWDPTTDLFTFNSQFLEGFLKNKVNTKRFLLQTAGRIFDPIGFLSPYIIRIKILIQEIWASGIDWDEDLPKHIESRWIEWFHEIKELNEIRIPRYYLSGFNIEDVERIELHCFSDASKRAYGAVAYIRAILKDNEVITSFVAAKSRVAPLKSLSIPRLELLGALLAARLSHKVAKELAFPVVSYFWTDSSITFYWIRGDSMRFKMFVRNRIKEIQNLSNQAYWFHCPGNENPADILTRGLKISELKSSHLWWEGPVWLKQDPTFWPKLENTSKTLDQDNLEMKKNTLVKTTILNEDKIENDLINRYSSFDKLVRISAWCLRFLNNCKLKSIDRKNNHLDSVEIQQATQKLIKIVQVSAFQSEINCLVRKHPLAKNSKLLNLNIFLDENGLIRIGGRLKFSNIPEFQKHQILLPKNHDFTDLLIKHYHEKFLHAGTQTTLSIIRSRYWIPSGRSRVRRVITKCLTCFKMKKQTSEQMMGDLPKDRVVPSRPFLKTGVDLAGPVIIKPNLKRSRVKLKAYIALFICFSTKAVHLEILSDLTTEAFLACFRRFIARRSKPSVMYSDNATNFKGTSSVLKSIYEIYNSHEIQKFSAEEGIQWKFIPPATPNFGGIWEANIKIMKEILVKTTKTTILNFEELCTLITQIEAILNSRPLSPMSEDPEDLQPLSPGHFLVGGPLIGLPESDIVLDSFSFSSRWSHLQRLRKQFWQRWTREFLNEQQQRSRWRNATNNIRSGQLVLMKDQPDVPQLWKLARILRVYPGPDGLVRVVDLKTSSGTLRRSVRKIAPLPIDQDVGQLSNGGRHGAAK